MEDRSVAKDGSPIVLILQGEEIEALSVSTPKKCPKFHERLDNSSRLDGGKCNGTPNKTVTHWPSPLDSTLFLDPKDGVDEADTQTTTSDILGG